MNKKYVEIVVSRYNEKLEWLDEYPFNQFTYTVYNKGINQEFNKTNVLQIIDLPNVGRCDHTYIYHIVNNYNNLAPITVFFPGSIDGMEMKKNNAIKILESIKKYKTAIFLGRRVNNLKTYFKNFTLDEWNCTNSENNSLNPESKLSPAMLRPFGKWYNYHFGNIIVKYYCIHGILSIHKLDIIKQPFIRYQQLLGALDKHSNPEVGHYIERSWAALFHPLLFTKVI
jgi:hypothetical protein